MDAHTVAFDDILQIRIQPGFRIFVQKLVGSRDRMDRHITERNRLPRVQTDRIYRTYPIAQNRIPVLFRKNKSGSGIGPRPDLPGIVIDMIQMIVGTQNDICSLQRFCRNGRRCLPVRIRCGVIINIHGSITGFYLQSHLPQPAKLHAALFLIPHCIPPVGFS